MHKSNCKYFKRSFRGKTLKMRFFAKNNAKSHHILYILLPIFITSLNFSAFASAVSYQTEITPTFTVNDTLSITVSSADLLIDNLIPGGDGGDSNTITITVNTNNEWGYVLSSTVGNTTYNNTNLTGVSSVFTNLSSEVDTLNAIPNNYWGYSFSTDNGSTWSKYNGLPLYTDETNTAILNESDARTANATTKFKIGAKAGSDQLSGTYQNVINFAVTNKPEPIPPKYMQDVTTWASELANTGDSLTAVDARDGKSYLVTRLADGKIWMTQNLDLELTSTELSSLNTDIDAETCDASGCNTAGYTTGYRRDSDTGVIYWAPDSETAYTANTVLSGTNTASDPNGWTNNDNTKPYSAEGGDVYYYTSGNTDNDNPYTSLSGCVDAGHNEEECKHYHRGNYYNWTAAIASNDSTSLSTQYSTALNSICPKGWELPVGRSDSGTATADSREFANLLYTSGIISGLTSTSYATDGFNSIRDDPLYFVRAGYVYSGSLGNAGVNGNYWSSSVSSGTDAYYLVFNSTSVNPANYINRYYGISVRCVAR